MQSNYLKPPISAARQPLMLSDSILNLALGDKKMLYSQNLVNPFKTGMYVREVRFDIGFGTTGPGTNGPGYGDIKVKLELGRHPVTNGYLPLWLLGKTLSPFEQAITWRFKRPVYVPSGEYIVPTFFYDPDPAGVATITLNSARFTVIGESCAPSDPVPEHIDVPYATGFIGTQRSVSGAGTTPADNLVETTNESHLVNSLQVPLSIERFAGRLNGAIGDFTVNNTVGAIFASASLLASNTLVRMVSSTGQMAVRDNTPMGLLFSAPEHAWVVDALLPPKGFFIASVTENWNVATGGGNPATGQVQLAMIGNRRVPLRG